MWQLLYQCVSTRLDRLLRNTMIQDFDISLSAGELKDSDPVIHFSTLNNDTEGVEFKP